MLEIRLVFKHVAAGITYGLMSYKLVILVY